VWEHCSTLLRAATIPLLRRVADYAIARHDPDLAGREDRYAGLLGRVVARQAHLIAQWMNLGFIHGVMNTDNMTLSGETIDYGPCAFMDRFDPETVFSSIDRHGRYAWSNQPCIAQWNLARLAEALLPLMAQGTGDRELAQAAEQANAILRSYDEQYGAAWLTGQRAKLGLTTGAHGIDPAKDQVDAVLAADWLALLHRAGADYTRAWRRLADCMEGDVNPLRAELLSGNEGSGDTLAALDALVGPLAGTPARNGFGRGTGAGKTGCRDASGQPVDHRAQSSGGGGTASRQ
jgi:uncharacterized protein YdiU (UPF0061 family)